MMGWACDQDGERRIVVGKCPLGRPKGI